MSSSLTDTPIGPVPTVPPFPPAWSLADLQRYLGDVPASRIRLVPSPSTATEDDLLRIRGEGPVCELIDGTLVEKTVGWYESALAGIILQLINNFLDGNPVGIALAPDGALRILPTRVRAPDVSVILRERMSPDVSSKPVPTITPDLVIEVLSESNTPAEMELKRREYFQSGVRLVWYIEPRSRTAVAYGGVDESQQVAVDGELDGRDVLPGFTLSLAELFQRMDQRVRALGAQDE